jgi:hypothetical protein
MRSGLVAVLSSHGSCPVASPSGFGSTHPPVGNPFRLQAAGDYPPATHSPPSGNLGQL